MVKKALVIGINYTGSAHALRGCINDAWNVANFLVNHWGYHPGDILVLTDDPTSKPFGGAAVKARTSDESHAAAPAAHHEEAAPAHDDKKDKKKKKEKADDHAEDDHKKEKKDKKKKEKPDDHAEDDHKKDKKEKKDKKGKDEKKDKKDKKEKKDKSGTRAISEEQLQALEDVYSSATRDITDEELQTRGVSGTFLRGKCTRAEILEGCRWLVTGAAAGDSLFLHYSGHGTQVADKTGDEEDGKDEAICPIDFQTAGVIVDDDLHGLLVKSLPGGVKLTALMDCCHSGTALDLAYRFEAKGKQAEASFALEKKPKKKKKEKKEKGGEKKPKNDRPLVVMLSGCEDHQVSADVVLDGSATGAVSFSVVSALTQHNMDLSFADLLFEVKRILKARVKNVQYPVLTTNQADFDFAQKFQP